MDATLSDNAKADPVRLLAELAQHGVTLRTENGKLQYSAPSGALNSRLKTAVRECREPLIELLTCAGREPNQQYEPFPLTDLQQAYLVGEQSFYNYHAPAVFYHEYAIPDIDTERMERAMSLLRHSHGILRLAVRGDGTQQVLPPEAIKGNKSIEVIDFSALADEEAQDKVAKLRERYRDDIPRLDSGRPFRLRLVKMPSGWRMQIALRLIAFDGTTIQLLFSELTRCYLDDAYCPPQSRVSYRDYVLGLLVARGQSDYQRAEQYWSERIADLPGDPPLPRAGEGRKSPGTMERNSAGLAESDWANFRTNAGTAGVSVGSALCTVFVETLHRWSDSEPALLTVLCSYRPPIDPDIRQLWGNCTTTVPVAVAPTTGSFTASARALQRRLWEDLDATAVSGVEIGRRMQQRNGPRVIPAPVVFASGIDLVGDAPSGFLLTMAGAELVHSAISTPQVLLDHQVYEEEGRLVTNFDFCSEAFPHGMIDEATAYYQARLLDLAQDADMWKTQVPRSLLDEQLADRHASNETAREQTPATLHQFFESGLKLGADRPAVVTRNLTMSYGELDAASCSLAARIAREGIRPGDIVAVLADKGVEQVVAVLGVLRAGAVYLPLDTKWPDARLRTILGHSGAVLVVTDGGPARSRAGALGKWRTLSVTLDAPQVPFHGTVTAPDEAAYVIYTSGSTGTPKGVVVAHAAAVNTIRDLVGRFELGPHDRVLAVSSLAFDLSVFDIFAPFSVGATIVFPADSSAPDPQEWGECVRHCAVTVWNSVPALLDVLLEYLGERSVNELETLRLIMMSGDWVPLGLLPKLRMSCPNAVVMSLGGATEAAIWSNWFPCADQPVDWPSVPYGYPLANQTMHVFDRALADTPTWVPGDLYIGGAGVAIGYLNEPERTAHSFLVHPRTGERLYRTGDRARYRPGGILEFLGRNDLQVKIRGFRIELGDIEAQLLAFPNVAAAVALVDPRSEEVSLAAIVVGVGESSRGALQEHLAAQLPTYMVPKTLHFLDSVPLSANGKVDRKALLSEISKHRHRSAQDSAIAPQTETEARLLEAWTQLLSTSVTSVEDDFFAIGGNSLLAVRLFHKISEVFSVELELSSLFENGTVRAQARLIDQGSVRLHGLLQLIALGSGSQHLVLVHPVGGNLLCYRNIIDEFVRLTDGQVTVHGLRAGGLYAGEILADGLDDMAQSYATAVAGIGAGASVHLAGWSMGGTIALRLAAVLRAQDCAVASVVTVDSFVGAGKPITWDEEEALGGFFTDLTGGSDVTAEVAATDDMPLPERLVEICRALAETEHLGLALESGQLARLFAVYRNNYNMLLRHHPEPDAIPYTAVLASKSGSSQFYGLAPLHEQVGAPSDVVRLKGNHYSVVVRPAAQEIAGLIAARISMSTS